MEEKEFFFENPALEDAVKEHFPELPLPTNEEDKKELLEFYSLGFDRGLMRQIDFRGETELSLFMLNRQAFLSKLSQKAGINFEKAGSAQSFTILRIDIAGVFSANQVKDELGQEGGDLVIQRAAKALQAAAAEFLQNIGKKDLNLILGRYGGDEFTIALTGEYSEKDLERLTEIIRNKITEQKAYFQTEKGPELKPLKLKDGKVEKIPPPEDENLKKLFYANLRRGVILSPEELNKEIVAFETNGEIDQGSFEAYLQELKAEGYYPLNISTPEEKANYLKTQHHEFFGAFEAAKRNNIPLQTITDFIENYLVGPLLDQVVITRFDLDRHLLAGEFRQIIAFEIKLKEVNEIYSYSCADNLIIDLCRQIRETLGEKASKVKIGRFGGVIFLGVKEGLDKRTLDNLLQLREAFARYGKETVRTKIGSALIHLPPQIEDKELPKIKERMFSWPSKIWLQRNLEYIFKDEQRAIEFQNLLEGTIEKSKDPIVNLLAAYFRNQRRGRERIKNATYFPENLVEAFIPEGFSPY